MVGRGSEHVTMVINIPTMSSTGAARFKAANGNVLLATVAGQATRTSPTTLSIVEIYTITCERDASLTQPAASR